MEADYFGDRCWPNGVCAEYFEGEVDGGAKGDVRGAVQTDDLAHQAS